VFATQLLVAEAQTAYATARSPWLEVLVDCPGVEKLFIYRVPDDLAVQVGDVVSVPFGSQQVGAIAVRFIAEAQLPEFLTTQGLAHTQVKPIEDVLAQGLFPPTYWQLLERVTTYYGAPLMTTIRAALPPRLLQRSQRRLRWHPQSLTPMPSPGISPTAQLILNIFQAGKREDYSERYIYQTVQTLLRRSRQPAGRSPIQQALRELIRQGWVSRELASPKVNRPKLRQVLTLQSTALTYPYLTPRQRELLNQLHQMGGEVWLTDFLQQVHTSRETIARLEQVQCVVVSDREVLRQFEQQQVSQPWQPPDRPKTLTSAQAQALQTLKAATGFTQFLLHGVTGSGKTEVYLQAIAPVLARGQAALVLVPEIGLTPQLTDRFSARFGDRVWVYHSGLSEGERFDTWRQMLQGEPQVVIGTRSAVFAPLRNLGLIILDEEHDTSFKQDQPAPTYHARRVATWRGELENCPVILGSATPALETWLEVVKADHLPIAPPPAYLSLPQRVGDRPLPTVQVVDMREELQAGNRSIFSADLQRAIGQLPQQQQQGILFIHRRGHSSFVGCRSCGETLDCPRCAVSLSYHHTHDRAIPQLRCHYCNYQRLQPQNCPACQSPYLKFFGSGTQRVTRELERLFPHLRVLRFDSDTTQRKGAHRQLLDRFAAGEADILVGTQMLTKGLDLPSVGLVGIVAADGLLGMPHYGAGERAFQTLVQVAGRAGRGDRPGHVILQTYQPDHPVVQAVQQHDYFAFLPAELALRRSLNYPPYARLALIKLSATHLEQVQAIAEQLTHYLKNNFKKYFQPPAPPFASGTSGVSAETVAHVANVENTKSIVNAANTVVEILGPAPAPIERIADRYRWQILLKFAREQSLSLQVEDLRRFCPSSVSLELDIDPLQMS